MKNLPPLLHYALMIFNVKRVLHVPNVNSQRFGQSKITRIQYEDEVKWAEEH
jgi:hypothetical protein